MNTARIAEAAACALAGFLFNGALSTSLAQPPFPGATAPAPYLVGTPHTLPTPSKPPLDLTDGARVLFIGDAMLAGEMEVGQIESHLRIRFPGRQLLCRNRAWKEDGLLSASGQGPVEILKAWIGAFKPNLAIIGYGMGHSLTNRTDPDAFEREVAGFVDAVMESGVGATPRWALVGPIPRETNGLVDTNAAIQNLQLRLYENRLRDLAARRGGLFVPLSDKFAQPALATRGITPLTRDSIHPNVYGYARLAESLEIAFNWKPNTWRVGLTEEGRLRDDNWGGTVSDFSASVTQACWTARREWLPNPVLMGKSRPLTMFTPPDRILIPNLKPGRYELNIDGVPVWTNSNEIWAMGEILFKGAPFDQAEKFRLAIVERNKAWSRYASALTPDSRDVAGTEDEQIKALDRKVHDLCPSVPHRFEIKPLL